MRSRLVLAPVVAAALVALAACGGSDDDSESEASASADVAARFRNSPITVGEVDELARDDGYLDFANQQDPGGNLAGTPEGRYTLTGIIDEVAIEVALDDLGIEVTDSAREQAEAASVDVEPEAGGLHDEEADDDQSESDAERLTDILAKYITLNEWLSQPENASEMASSLFERFDKLGTETCGEAMAVKTTAAATTRQNLTDGLSMADAATGDEVVASTADGSLGTCITESAIPSEVYFEITQTPIGEIGEASAHSSKVGETVTLFVAPAERRNADATSRAAATEALAQRFETGGVTSFLEVAHIQEAVVVEDDWGQWDPRSGVADPSDIPEIDTFTVSGSTTTTAAPTTAAPTTVPATTPLASTGDPSGVNEIFGPSDPGTGDLAAREQAALEAGVPAVWREAVPVQLGQVEGTSSYSYPSGLLEMGTYHLNGDWNRLVAITSHEFGHHIAFRYGTQAELGAAPQGWPTSGDVPVEHWADCVSRSFTGTALGSHNQAPCDGEPYTWTASWLGQGPAAHPRTG